MAQQVQALDQCPDTETLAAYVFGKLPETKAVSLSGHLDRCAICQRALDRLDSRQDSLGAALRHSPRANDPGSSPELALLIAGVQRDGGMAPPPSDAPRSLPQDEPVTLDHFVTCLRKSRLINDSEVDLLIEQYRPADPSSFARSLIGRKKLTSFQAKALIRGKWKGFVLGQYTILEKLGAGGMGTVFRARHRRMGRIVCLKVLHASGRKSPQMVERFRREAKMVAALDHPHIVVAHDADEADGVPFLVMQFVEGKDLAAHIENYGPLPVNQALPLVRQAAEALEYAHGEGVVHRDIKPHNLLLDSSGQIKILDMGLARFDSYLGRNPDATTFTSMTMSGAIMGTIDYLSPEQALNGRNADARSDIYSLGCTLHFMLTGKVLHEGETVMEKLIAHREDPSPRLDDVVAGVPNGLDAIFQRMTAKDPDDRYASMAGLADDLDLLLDGGQPAALLMAPSSPIAQEAPDPPPLMAPRHGQGRRQMSIAALTTAAVIGLLAWGTADYWYPSLANSIGLATDTTPSDPATLMKLNGGPGRAMVVIPFNGFDSSDYGAVTKALSAKGVDFVTASSELGMATPRDRGQPQVKVDVSVKDFGPEAFDGMVFCGGDIREFTHKGASGETVKQLVHAALEKPRVVASISNARDILNDCHAKCEFKSLTRLTGVEYGHPKDRLGTVAYATKYEHAGELVRVVFDEILVTPSDPKN